MGISHERVINVRNIQDQCSRYTYMNGWFLMVDVGKSTSPIHLLGYEHLRMKFGIWTMKDWFFGPVSKSSGPFVSLSSSFPQRGSQLKNEQFNRTYWKFVGFGLRHNFANLCISPVARCLCWTSKFTNSQYTPWFLLTRGQAYFCWLISVTGMKSLLSHWKPDCLMRIPFSMNQFDKAKYI